MYRICFHEYVHVHCFLCTQMNTVCILHFFNCHKHRLCILYAFILAYASFDYINIYTYHDNITVTIFDYIDYDNIAFTSNTYIQLLIINICLDAARSCVKTSSQCSLASRPTPKWRHAEPWMTWYNQETDSENGRNRPTSGGCAGDSSADWWSY